MSTWRRVALEQLPEHRNLITKSANPMALWIDLRYQFEQLYTASPLNDDLIGRFYHYARWCYETTDLQKKPTDVSTAVACAFYEHLLENRKVREDLHRWISHRELVELSSVFTYHFPKAEFDLFEKEFQKKAK